MFIHKSLLDLALSVSPDVLFPASAMGTGSVFGCLCGVGGFLLSWVVVAAGIRDGALDH
jgi:hypothetical protein